MAVNMKCGKALGLDGVPVETLGKTGTEWLGELFNKSFSEVEFQSHGDIAS